MKFIRQDAHKKKNLRKSGWRKPKGWQSKIRLSKAGHSTKVKPGFGTQDRGLINGKTVCIVATLEELTGCDAKKHHIYLSGKLGGRKKAELLKAAAQANITLANGSADTLQKIEDGLKVRQVARKKKEKKAQEARKTEPAKEKKEEKKAQAKPAKEEAKEKSQTDAQKEKARLENEKDLIKKGAQ